MFGTPRTSEVHHMAQTMVISSTTPPASNPAIRTKDQVRYRIAETGVIPAVRVASEKDALFVAQCLSEAGIRILEISTVFPGAFHAICHVAESLPGVIVGAGNILDVETARRCVDEGAKFLATDGLISDVVELANQEEIVVFTGALTPTEIIAARKAGSDFVKVVPCDAMGGPGYIRSLKSAMPQIQLIAAGGVNQRTASSFIKAGATALGVGRDLIPLEAVHSRQAQRIQEMARRFLSSVSSGRD
jgi:2-dehydro-3-deoxyphosphogluconate aldolase/(4S)-4-hydroxy-2-oxoglutarate aldolase